MPPSGYSIEQSDYIRDFLESVSHSLEKEGIEKNLTPIQAMEAECENIHLIAKDSDNLAEKSVLFLTKHFYLKVLEQAPQSYLEYRKSVETVLPNIREVILSVHVPEI